MIRYYKTIDNKLEKLTDFESGCWINLVEPSQNEIREIANKFSIDVETIKSALDEEERSRIDVEEDHTLILIDIPIDESDIKSTHYSTIPLGIILAKECIITVCTTQTKVLNDFIAGHVKGFYTYKRTRFILQILNRISTSYLIYLRQIDKKSLMIEKRLHKSMKNRELIQLHSLEKSLVYFSTSLKANEITLEKMLKLEIMQKYEEDQDVLEDVIIENKQALEMATIYGDILSRIMDAFSAIISNNQNNVMQFLTSITLITTIPTIVSGFFGMNVGGIPYANDINGFWIVMLITTLICLAITFFMSRNKLL